MERERESTGERKNEEDQLHLLLVQECGGGGGEVLHMPSVQVTTTITRLTFRWPGMGEIIDNHQIRTGRFIHCRNEKSTGQTRKHHPGRVVFVKFPPVFILGPASRLHNRLTMQRLRTTTLDKKKKKEPCCWCRKSDYCDIEPGLRVLDSLRNRGQTWLVNVATSHMHCGEIRLQILRNHVMQYHGGSFFLSRVT